MEIRSGEDALAFLERCWHDPAFGNDESLRLNGCCISLRLDPGDGVADFKAMRAVNLLQVHLNHLYLVAKTGAPRGRLSDPERELLSLSLTIGTGSTVLNMDTVKAMLAIQKLLPAHWSIRARNIVIAGLVAATAASPFIDHYATYRTETDKARIEADGKVREAEVNAKASLAVAEIQAKGDLAVATLQSGGTGKTAVREAPSPQLDLSSEAKPFYGMPVILASLVRDDTTNLVAYAVSDEVAWRPALLDLAPKGGTVQWNGSLPIQAAAAKAYAALVRKEAVKRRQLAKAQGHPGLIETPWVTEVLRTHSAPGAMRLGASDA